jgi:hypothetical protein
MITLESNMTITKATMISMEVTVVPVDSRLEVTHTAKVEA